MTIWVEVELIKWKENAHRNSRQKKRNWVCKNGNNNNYFVITSVGFRNNIEYQVTRISKSKGEIVLQLRNGYNEDFLYKASLIINKKEVSRIENSCYFNYKIYCHI